MSFAEGTGIAPGMYPDMPESVYRSDPCERPSLNQSTANILLQESPFHAKRATPRLGGKARFKTKQMGVGTIAHAMLLGQPIRTELLAFKDYKTKAAQEAKAAAELAGKIPVLVDHWKSIREGAEEVCRKIKAKGLSFDGRSEVSFVWQKFGVWHRARLDHLLGYHIIDLKIGESPSPQMIDRHVRDFGYRVQNAAYTEALEECMPDAKGRVKYTLVFAEVEEPYCVTTATLSGASREIGHCMWSYARQTWQECLENDDWPEYNMGQEYLVDAKPWEMKEAEKYGFQSNI